MHNYVSPVIEKLNQLLPGCEPDLIRLYALLALVCGTDTGAMDVHAAWAIWRNATQPDHRFLVPFADLSYEVRALDAPYVLAIHEAAGEAK